MKRFLFNWSPVLLFAGLIYILSALPLHVPEKTDKILHFFEYALMGFFTTRGVLLSRDFSKLWGIVLGGLLASAFGAFDEFHQSFVPGRQASIWDVTADMLGSFAGAALFVYFGSFLYRSRKLYPRSPSKCG